MRTRPWGDGHVGGAGARCSAASRAAGRQARLDAGAHRPRTVRLAPTAARSAPVLAEGPSAGHGRLPQRVEAGRTPGGGDRPLDRKLRGGGKPLVAAAAGLGGSPAAARDDAGRVGGLRGGKGTSERSGPPGGAHVGTRTLSVRPRRSPVIQGDGRRGRGRGLRGGGPESVKTQTPAAHRLAGVERVTGMRARAEHGGRCTKRTLVAAARAPGPILKARPPRPQSGRTDRASSVVPRRVVSDETPPQGPDGRDQGRRTPYRPGTRCRGRPAPLEGRRYGPCQAHARPRRPPARRCCR